MTDADTYSRPERFTERQKARRSKLSKRVDALRNREGLCALCVYRDRTFGLLHCRSDMERRDGRCDRDGKLPRFAVDTKVVEALSDAA